MALLVNPIVLLFGLTCSVFASGDKSVVSFDETSGSILLADASNLPSVLIDTADWAGVLLVTGNLAPDFGRVTGTNETVSKCVQPIPTTVLGTLTGMLSNMVSNAVVSITISYTGLAKSENQTLDLWLLKPGFMLQKIFVNLGGVRPSYLGPPESIVV